MRETQNKTTSTNMYQAGGVMNSVDVDNITNDILREIFKELVTIAPEMVSVCTDKLSAGDAYCDDHVCYSGDMAMPVAIFFDRLRQLITIDEDDEFIRLVRENFKELEKHSIAKDYKVRQWRNLVKCNAYQYAYLLTSLHVQTYASKCQLMALNALYADAVSCAVGYEMKSDEVYSIVMETVKDTDLLVWGIAQSQQFDEPNKLSLTRQAIDKLYTELASAETFTLFDPRAKEWQVLFKNIVNTSTHIYGTNEKRCVIERLTYDYAQLAKQLANDASANIKAIDDDFIIAVVTALSPYSRTWCTDIIQGVLAKVRA